MHIHKIGDTAYYKSVFGMVREVIILDTRIRHSRGFFGDINDEYKYLIQFKTGTKKIVTGEDLF